MLTIDRIQTGIGREMKILEELVEEMREAGDESARAEVAYKTAYAQSRLSIRALHGKPTVDFVEAAATVDCADQHLAYLIASNRMTTAREALRAAQSRLDGWRSLMVTMRAAGG